MPAARNGCVLYQCHTPDVLTVRVSLPCCLAISSHLPKASRCIGQVDSSWPLSPRNSLGNRSWAMEQAGPQTSTPEKRTGRVMETMPAKTAWPTSNELRRRQSLPRPTGPTAGHTNWKQSLQISKGRRGCAQRQTKAPSLHNDARGDPRRGHYHWPIHVPPMLPYLLTLARADNLNPNQFRQD